MIFITFQPHKWKHVLNHRLTQLLPGKFAKKRKSNCQLFGLFNFLELLIPSRHYSCSISSRRLDDFHSVFQTFMSCFLSLIKAGNPAVFPCTSESKGKDSRKFTFQGLYRDSQDLRFGNLILKL